MKRSKLIDCLLVVLFFALVFAALALIGPSDGSDADLTEPSYFEKVQLDRARETESVRFAKENREPTPPLVIIESVKLNGYPESGIIDDSGVGQEGEQK